MSNTFDDLPEVAKTIWLAGFVDAHVTIYDKQSRMEFKVANEDTAKKFVQVAGMGGIVKRPNGKIGEIGEHYQVQSASVGDVVMLYERVIPFLADTKKRQAQEKVNVLKRSTAYQKHMARVERHAAKKDKKNNE